MDEPLLVFVCEREWESDCYLTLFSLAVVNLLHLLDKIAKVIVLLKVLSSPFFQVSGNLCLNQ